jgi:hypothetical protein
MILFDYFFIECDWTNSALCSNKLWTAYTYMFNVHKAIPQNVYHRPIPHNKNKKQVTCVQHSAVWCTVQATPTPVHTKHNKTKQMLSPVEISMYFVLPSTREQITKLLQDKFQSPSCLLKVHYHSWNLFHTKIAWTETQTIWTQGKTTYVHHSNDCFCNTLSIYHWHLGSDAMHTVSYPKRQ